MGSSPYDRYFLVPSECVGRPCVDVVKVSTPFIASSRPVVPFLTLLLLLPRLLLLKALLVKEEAAFLALLLVLFFTSSALSIC